MSKTSYTQPWINKPLYDVAFILLPPFLALLVVALLPAHFKNSGDMPVMVWVMLVLFVDVAHVYSTLYNTYLDKDRLRRHSRLFIFIPIVCYIAGVALHIWSGSLFWSVLAYLAVFHFIRQQYGFMRLYARRDDQPDWEKIIDGLAIYSATIYPLIYWHCTPGRNFNWFIDGDFIIGNSSLIKEFSGVIYLMIACAYIVKEGILLLRDEKINIPKNGVIIGTYLSWYFGIIYFNGDMAFTLLNVVAHGIPYMALIWSEMNRTEKKKTPAAQGIKVKGYGLAVFVGSLILLAYLEEGLWDGFIWQDHKSVFGLFRFLPHISSDFVLALLVPLLSLPQSTHYVLDGFIWRKKYA
ncbi:hypothetical protein CJD36_009945 [Flavipsychrobacter stenotrophus]|uniref:Uncharacterized protein n=1 Tax=Flavipsychrobacter stenotrophus TaxID=2077091 RepID=A0A2S7SYS6_9BACT|nr:hypothetical protein [Flavipsychrobacter stenotrophus]PQJ12100.1 hypothetical protein CJD36_009945 [Flavipsychrobacter stenotrophus]